MLDGSLPGALEREHRDIDTGIETFIAGYADSRSQPAVLMQALEALRRHIYLEEEILFPPLREAGLAMPIFVMLREHGELWRTMDTLTDLLDHGADGDRVLDVCRALLTQLAQHNAKEEPIIYPHADSGLSDTVGAELTRFLESGSTPEGWACRTARPTRT